MQLLIIIPRQPESTGNHVTANRFAAELPAYGWDCDIIETAPDSPTEIDAALSCYHPDIVLLLHAYRSGRPWLLADTPDNLPLAVLMTGTDYNHDQQIPERAAIIQLIHQRATAIIIQNPLLLQRLSQEQSALGSKLKLLPPGIRLGSERYPLRDQLQLPSDTLLFLFPAGIRPVKGNLELLLMCDQLAEEQANFQLAFCGPPLDADYSASFFAALKERPWAHYLGEIPKAAIADAMRQAEVIINNSTSEGISNALVEAVSLGRPILASNIVGNRAVVQHGKNGLLFFGQKQFNKQARQLIRYLKLRKQLSRPNPAAYSAEQEGLLLTTILNQMASTTEHALENADSVDG